MSYASNYAVLMGPSSCTCPRCVYHRREDEAMHLMSQAERETLNAQEQLSKAAAVKEFDAETVEKALKALIDLHKAAPRTAQKLAYRFFASGQRSHIQLVLWHRQRCAQANARRYTTEGIYR